jgi:transposase
LLVLWEDAIRSRGSSATNCGGASRFCTRPRSHAGRATQGRYPVDDRKVFSGILFVLHTGIRREWLPAELGFGSGMTCWQRLRDW